MAMATTTAPQAQPGKRATSRFPLAWLGILPFFIFGAIFLIYPAISILTQSFVDEGQGFTLQNIGKLTEPAIVASYWYSIRLSAVSALLGGVLGALLAAALTIGGVPRFLRPLLLSFSGVASNFAGVPLAFAFVATLGNLGLVNWALGYAGLSLRQFGFSLYSFWGLALTYTYFQIPLMLLVIVPAFDGLRREWQEAAISLGASPFHYWRYIGLPILLPTILGTTVLLFGNAFGAHATAFALTGGGAGTRVITILIGAQLSSDTQTNPGLGNALALGMIAIMALTIAISTRLQRLTGRWTRGR